MRLPRSPRLAKYLFIALIIAILGYTYYEAQNILHGPQITLSDDTDAILLHEEYAVIEGNAKNVVNITLNGRPLFIDDTGFFSEEILLAPGVNHLIFEAWDKFDRRKKEELQVVYEPYENTTSAPQQNDTEPDTIEASLE